jgi:hypothetical protein
MASTTSAAAQGDLRLAKEIVQNAAQFQKNPVLAEAVQTPNIQKSNLNIVNLLPVRRDILDVKAGFYVAFQEEYTKIGKSIDLKARMATQQRNGFTLTHFVMTNQSSAIETGFKRHFKDVSTKPNTSEEFLTVDLAQAMGVDVTDLHRQIALLVASIDGQAIEINPSGEWQMLNIQDPPPPYVEEVRKKMSELDDSHSIEDSEHIKGLRLELAIQNKRNQVVMNEIQLAKFLAEHPEVQEVMVSAATIGKTRMRNIVEKAVEAPRIKQDDPQSVAALLFLRDKCVYELGARTKSGDVIRAFIEWCKQNDYGLGSQATNKISPLIQNVIPKYNDKVKFNTICSFYDIATNKRTQTPGFMNLRMK